MMTFGLNRPVYSFGLLVPGNVFVFGGMCGWTAEDARRFIGEDARLLTPDDIDRVLDTNPELRVKEILEFRDLYTWHDFRVHVAQDVRKFTAEDDRIFSVEDTRMFVVERKCDDVQSD